MAALSTTSANNILGNINKAGLGAPLMLLAMLAMMIIPLPPLLLDILFTFNISLALVILLASIYAKRPLDFAAFPTLLLIATLLRLALNIASTRVVLLHGHSGHAAAGQVIKAFGDFVVGGNFAVGFVVFAILVIINFVVVTKGAGRISEVSARFTLDAMPGKQMAIDADLNAGIIGQEEARTRRREVAGEADFYGAMDGASKFVRGDAIAGILILFINLIGGLAIGVVQYHMPVGEAAKVFTLLTIGDGLVAQIPALLLATAAAFMVTRTSTASDMGEQIVSQLFANPKSLIVTGGVLISMGIIPGMPNFAFLTMGGGAIGAAWWMNEKAKARKSVEADLPPPPPPTENTELSWDDVLPTDAIGLEVGYRLIPMVDRNQNGQLLGRLRGVRKKLSQELGFLVPAVHIRDNLDLEPNQYRLTVHGAIIGQSAVHADKEMAINPGQVYGQLRGTVTRDPVFDLEAVWIGADQREQAQSLGYTVVDASTVIATHLSQIVQDNAQSLLGHEEAQKLLDGLKKTNQRLVEDLIPKLMPLSVLVKVLQNLLAEHVPVRDIRTILEVLAEYGPRNQDTGFLTAQVRAALGRLIVQQINGSSPELPVITLDFSLERILQQSLETTQGTAMSLEPNLANRMLLALRDAHTQREAAGQPSVLLVADGLREFLARFARPALKGLHVLGFNEVPSDTQIRIVATVGDSLNKA
ncbi:MAG: flagellar biosynthesis protein FlhA [Proteobacteria bacterium]|jgi:flagellar biosynthesis protein FlhA|nr:flagellar biosynthesis protein FlhA [Pseudomonadota bacterium]MBK8960120.1 flagellar biosynthesis protein FlhA [Pseudomonadota bacterium]